MYFSTRHWARLLGGYSGFAAYGDRLLAAWQQFPSAAGVDALRELGATHLTYNCAVEPRPWRCGPTLEALGANAALELVATEQWEGAEVRLYRIR
jgi:hypothetical protein